MGISGPSAIEAFPGLDGTLVPRRGSCDSISAKEKQLRDSESATGPLLSLDGPAEAEMYLFETVQVGTLKTLSPAQSNKNTLVLARVCATDHKVLYLSGKVFAQGAFSCVKRHFLICIL